MRKIYSLVLMTAMLFIGANAWAVNVAVSGSTGTRADLQTAIDNAATGTTLTLQNDFTFDGPVWLGTENMTDAAKSIILDLNGHNISMIGSNNNCYFFVLTHGELLVRNSSATVSQIILSGSSTDGTQIFSVFGSYRSSRWNEAGNALVADSINTRTSGWFSHLEIGERVKIVAGTNCLGTGVAIDALFAGEGAIKAVVAKGKTINYRTDIFAGNFGLAQGVRVDMYGDVEIIPGQGGSTKSYGIKANGLLAKPVANKAINSACESITYVANYATEVTTTGTHTVNHALDTLDVPFIYVHNTSNLKTDNTSSKSAAVYSSGYSKMLIEGHCEGSCGVFASSGSVTINDAEIISTSESYSTPNGGGSVSGSGSAVVVNSRDGYAGEVELIVSGDSKITSDKGYGIQEVVNTTNGEPKVDNITIDGGTIEGGSEGGAIAVSEPTINSSAEVTVYGGNIEGDIQVGNKTGTGALEDVLPKDQSSNPTSHVTTVTDPETGKTTVIISEGAPVPAAEKDKETVTGQTGTVNWKHTDNVTTTPMAETLVGDLTLAELEINQSYNQTLTLGDPSSATPSEQTVTLTVDRVILGHNAQIIVNPGSKLIVKGDQGIVAPSVENIILRTSETSQALFLFNPAVTSNRHPNATVEFATKSYRKTEGGVTTRVYQRFGIPTHVQITEIESDPLIQTALYAFGWGTTNDWDMIGILNGTPAVDYARLNKPFTSYQMLTNAESAGTVYKMKGEIVGNVDASIDVYANAWQTFSNSYTAEIDVETLVKEGNYSSIYVYKRVGAGYVWESVGLKDFEGWFTPSVPLRIAPMQSFYVKSSTTPQPMAINYDAMVWQKRNYAATAPARMMAQNITLAKLTVSTDEESNLDNLYLMGADRFSEDFEDGYDAEKLMNDGCNLYVMGDTKLCSYATTELQGTYLGFSCVEGGVYTINFSNLNGTQMVLVDLVTGARTIMVDDATYQFTAQDNEVNDYRFQIIGRQEMPTDIESVATETIGTEGIYTITGQYLGNMSIWNTLPAGLYIVDGVKKVK